MTAQPVLTERPAAAAGGGVPGPTLSRLIRGELLKLRTTNLWWIMAICAFAATALALLLNGFIAHSEISDAKHPPDFSGGPGQPPPEVIEQQEADWRASHDLHAILIRHAANLFTSGQYFGLLIVMLLGAILVTGEYYHQTATTTFLTAPRRSRVIGAKVGAAIIIGAIAWLATTLIDLAVGTMILSGEGESTNLSVWAVQRAIVMNLPAYALWALLGMGLGALIRNQIAATLVGAGLYLIGSQIVQLVFFLVFQFLIKETWVLQAMVAVPSVASSVMISPERLQLGNTTEGAPIYGPAWWVGALVLVAYGILATALGTQLVRRRDIS